MSVIPIRPSVAVMPNPRSVPQRPSRDIVAGLGTLLLGPEIDVVAIEIDDSWARDAGPCFLLDAEGNLGGASFRFNAWGGKYWPYDRDDAFADAVLGLTGARAFTSSLVASSHSDSGG